MPLLHVQWGTVPQAIHMGQVFKTTLTLSNNGDAPLTSLSVALSHPAFVFIHSIRSDVPEEESATSAKRHLDNNLSDPSVHRVPLGDTNILPPGGSLSLDIFVRGDRIGTHTLMHLFRYACADEKLPKTFAVRFARSVMSLNVVPSIKMAALPRPSAVNANEFIVGIETENMLSEHDVVVSQVSSSSVAWCIEPVATEEYVG